MTGSRFDEMGAYLLGLWSLPDTVVEAVAHRKMPSRSPVCEVSALTISHIAYCLTQHSGRREPPDCLDQDYLSQLDLRGSWESWSTACETTLEDAA